MKSQKETAKARSEVEQIVKKIAQGKPVMPSILSVPKFSAPKPSVPKAPKIVKKRKMKVKVKPKKKVKKKQALNQLSKLKNEMSKSVY